MKTLDSAIVSPATNSIDVQQLIDRSKISSFQWVIFILSCLVILTDGFDTGAMGFIAPSLLKEWGLAKPDLGPVLSAALFGMALGAMSSGILADKLGRKWVVCLTVLFYGAFCAISSTSNSLNELVVYRFLTGLGLGAAMPNVATLAAEYMPKRVRLLMVNLVLLGFPLGIAIGGFLSASVIPAYGWRTLLLIGGVLPLMVLVFLLFALPESLQFLVVKNKARDKILAIVQKIEPKTAQHQGGFITGVDTSQNLTGNNTLGMILSSQYRLGTLLLWLTCFMGMLVFYLLTGWLAVLLSGVGYDTAQASTLTAIFPVGGAMGTIALGYFMDRFNPNRVLVLGFLCAAVFLIAASMTAGLSSIFGILIFLSGAMIGGSLSAMPGFTATFYPAQMRATGVSWMHGIGRTGAITGTFIGAGLLKMNIGIAGILLFLAAPALIAMIALSFKARKTVDAL